MLLSSNFMALAYLLLCATIFNLDGTFGQESDYSDNDAEILILGAGPAGLHSAGLFLDNGITDFIALEGDSEPGGILKLVEFGGLQLESGAPWGYPPVKRIFDALDVSYHESNYDSYVVRNDVGMNVTSDFDEMYNDYDTAKESADTIAKDSINGKRLDIAEKVALAMGGWISSSPLENAIEWYEIDFEYGLPSRFVSLVGPYGQDFGGDAQYYITDRNGGIFRGVLERLDEDHLRTNKVVQQIDQSGDRVVVITQDGSQYTADYVLVTFSVGVLQKGGVTFTPELPPWKTEQICRFQRGTIDPIFLKFPSKFWEDEEWILHAAGKKGYYPAFMNAEAEGLFPAGSNILIGFVTGEEAVRVEGLSDEEVRAEVLGVLKGMYGEANVPDLEEFYLERWATNPLHYGTQSTWPIPANVPADSMQRLQAHVGRVFFANDAAHEFIGTVSGSVASGEISTAEIIGCLFGEYCNEYQPEETYGGKKECVPGPKPGKRRKNGYDDPAGNVILP